MRRSLERFAGGGAMNCAVAVLLISFTVPLDAQGKRCAP